MRLYNTLTRKKEEFIPLKPNEIKMYSCGPTVYNYFHIGNARPFIIFDALRRYFEYRGNKVIMVQNFTDVDDKMINKANELSITVKELAQQFIDEYFKDAAGLGVCQATFHPRATENIDAIIALIEKLIQKGYAYNVEGDIYFSTKKFKEYGKLSHQPLEDLELGARIDINEKKADPMDFALWKKQKAGEPAWESPWGMGRPGWHIECSAMANKYLGDTIDIHSGGQDLIFPHHENEVAQSEAANDAPFARYWLHNGYINVNNQKMSKSLGNFFTVRDVAAEFNYEVIRFFMLSAHYRSPINFSHDLMVQAETGLERLYNCISNCEFLMQSALQGETDSALVKVLSACKDNFIAALEDDFNTALAISSLFDIAKEVNSNASQATYQTLEYGKNALTELGGVLGLLGRKKEASLDEEIAQLIEKRQQARAEKNFVIADEIRDTLLNRGIVLEDTPSGVKWKKI